MNWFAPPCTPPLQSPLHQLLLQSLADFVLWTTPRKGLAPRSSSNSPLAQTTNASHSAVGSTCLTRWETRTKIGRCKNCLFRQVLKPDVTQEHVYLATAKNIVKGRIVGDGNQENVNFIHLLVKRRAWKFRIWLESYYSYIADFPVKKPNCQPTETK